MGVTHYWVRATELPSASFRSAVTDVQIALTRSEIPLAGFEGVGRPIFTSTSVVFNGVDNMGCEPFEIHQTEFDRRGRQQVFSSCKTQRFPYDAAVKISLIVFSKHLHGHIRVMSDEDDLAWDSAKAVVHSACGFGRDFVLDSKV